MGITAVDIIIIIGYLIAVALIGSFSGGRQKSTKDYYLGGSNVPWWAVAFSIVAAETSSLTFISIPGLAYISNLNFLQLTIGYLIARIIIAFVFLPAYKTGRLTTAYAFLGERFGIHTQRYASTVFLFTRIAADGVRLFATAIPLALIFKTTVFFSSWSNFQIYVVAIVIIAIVSFVYTFTGGVKGVIWADVLQMSLYIGGAFLALVILLDRLPAEFMTKIPEMKTQIFNFSFGDSIAEFFRKPYTFLGAIIGGTFLSMASHGTDQLIVQRLLTTRTLKDSQKAIITSGVVIIFQFTLFMAVGLLLYAFFDGAALNDPSAPFHKSDEIFPFFIIKYLPEGARGLIVAGLFAAAMSTLAGSMSSLSGSVIFDLYKPLVKGKDDPKKELLVSRIITLAAAAVLVLTALIFITMNQAVVELALGIASITYGGLLGAFLLGLFSKDVTEKGAITGFTAGISVMLLVSLFPYFCKALFYVYLVIKIYLGIDLGFMQSLGAVSEASFLHWTWFVLLGSTVTIISGMFFRKSAE